MALRFAGVLLVAGLLALGTWGAAQAASGEAAVSVTPAVYELRLHPDESEVAYGVSVTNRTASEISFEFAVADFQALDSRGGVEFIEAADYPYALAPWLRLSEHRATLAPGESHELTVTVLNDRDLAPGGHYGAVLVTAAAPPTTAEPQVGFERVVASLLFLTKLGGEVYDLHWAGAKLDSGLWRAPEGFSTSFDNRGNVHTVPGGQAVLRDPLGREVRRGRVNPGAGRVLPGSVRIFDSSLVRERAAWLPGYYTLNVEYSHSGNPQVKEVLTRRFVWNLLPLGVFVLSVGAAAALGWRLYPWLYSLRRRWQTYRRR